MLICFNASSQMIRWAASMLGSAAFIFGRNPQQWAASLSWSESSSNVMLTISYWYVIRTFSQKLVQARMVAQGATVAVLIASAGLSQLKFKDDDDDEQHHHDKQWQDIVSNSLPPRTCIAPSLLRASSLTSLSSRSINRKRGRHLLDQYIHRIQEEVS